MPIITGPITLGGAVVDVLVGVDDARIRLLRKHGLPVPTSRHVRAMVDTGASLSGFDQAVFTSLGLTPTRQRPVATPSTPTGAPFMAAEFYVRLSLVAGGVAHPFKNAWVIAVTGFQPSEGFTGLIGRDVLDYCSFSYHGTAKHFEFSF